MEIKIRKTVLFYSIISASLASTLFNSSQYTLGTNLLANPSFVLATVSSTASYSQLFSSSMAGWRCQNTCELYLIDRICKNYGKGCNLNYTRGINLDCNNYFDNISQTVSIQNQSQYLVTLKWIPPYTNPLNKKFRLEINQTAVFDISVNSSVTTVFTN